jgi:hypothetical protein
MNVIFTNHLNKVENEKLHNQFPCNHLLRVWEDLVTI